MYVNKIIKRTLLASVIAGATLPASALQINLIDTGGVTGSSAELGFQIAAKYWESVLTNDAVINFEVGFSSLDPGVLGGTSSSLYTFVPIDTYYSLLNATQTSAIDTMAVSNLALTSPTGSVQVQVPDYIDSATFSGISATGSRLAPDGYEISNTIAISSANVKALVGGDETGIDGHIEFSSDFNFDFDPSNGITAGTYDFIGVAVHEMGHALGFLSGADDFDYSVGYTGSVDDAWWGYSLDMFRYSAPGVLDWTFGTDSYFSLDGGETAYMDGFFSTGTNYGDTWQASHWKAPATDCVNFLGVMNPYTCGGLMDQVTALDLAFFDAIGWNVNVDVTTNALYMKTTAQMYADAVPEPTTWALMLGAIGGLIGLNRRKNRQAK